MERATHRIERTKQLSVLEGALWAAMNGIGTYFITPFALLLGASPFAVGLLKSFSTLAGAVGNYLGAWWMQFEKNRKQLLYKFVMIQALLWIPLALLPLVQVYTVLLLIVIYSLITLFGAFVGPAWTSLMCDVVGTKNRGSYFGKRNKVAGVVELLASLAAGAFLSWMTNNPFIGFGITFIAAFLFRYASARSFHMHWDPRFKPKRESLFKMLKLPKDSYLRNLIYLSAGMLFATSIASPFFAVYMLRELNFGYFDFAIAMAASTLATLITQPYWGKVIDKRGTRPVLFATSVLIPFIPLIWIPANSLLYVIAVQIFSGGVWAGFDLAMFNIVLKIAPRKELHSYSAHINGLGSLMTFLGGIAGSFLALTVEGTYVGLIGGLQIIFLISAVGRFLVTASTITRITPHMSIEGKKFLMRVITVYPIKGVVAEVAEFQHLLSSIRERIR